MPFIPYAPYQQSGVVSPTVSRQHSERLPTVEEDEQEEVELVEDNERVRQWTAKIASMLCTALV